MKCALGRLVITSLCLACTLQTLARAQERILHVSPRPLARVGTDLQFRTIAQAAAAVRAGDRVVIHEGVYREQVAVTASGTARRPIRFEAEPGSTVVVTGADPLTKWTKDPAAASGENIFITAWPHRFIPWSAHFTHPDDDYHRVIGRVEQVFVQGLLLHQVLARSQMSRGTFFVDMDRKQLYVWAPGNQALRIADLGPDEPPQVEASVRTVLWESKGSYVTLKGLRFRYAANRAQEGAVQQSGRGDCLEDCVIERVNGPGAVFQAPDQTVRRCTFQQNGQLGWGANGAHNLRFTECLTRGNNTKEYDRGWEAGSCKVVLSRGVVIEKCRFLENRGTGVWFDIGNEAATIRNCLIADNEDAGIFYEISYGLHAHDNVIIGNGLSTGAAGWGANGGIALSSSPGCVIERNLLVGNAEGFQFREQPRRTPTIGMGKDAPAPWVWNHDETIRNNLIAFNRSVQIGGWFDVWDERHWPRALQKHGGREKPDYVRTEDFAREYRTAIDAGAPTGLSLERLNLRFGANLYALREGQGLYQWGAAWRRNERYDSLARVQGDLGLESGSRVADVYFADAAALDFRMPAGSTALMRGAYPKGDVPGVRLGVMPGAKSPARRHAGVDAAAKRLTVSR